MPTTFYERLVKYYGDNKETNPLGFNQKASLGRKIINEWHNQPKPFPQLERVQSIEDSGTYTVLSYPDTFIPTIDHLIFESFQVPVKRKRIISGQRPVISAKPTSK